MQDTARERVRQFERLGGVDLSRLSVEERRATLDPLIHTGTAHFKRAVFQFQCGMCGRIEKNDQQMEPMCTGPNWTDDHPPEVMIQF